MIRRSSIAAGVLTALLVAGWAAGVLLIVGCSENLHPGSARKSVCDTVAGGALEWWLAVLWPAVLYAASRLVPGLRRHGLAVGSVVAALAMAFWAPLLVIVSR